MSSIAIILSGRIYTKDYNTMFHNLKIMFSDYSTVCFFISVNKIVHDSEFTNRFVNDIKLQGWTCVLKIVETHVPSTIYKYKKTDETDHYRVYSMFYHNKLAFDMINKQTFDIVMKYRTDVLLNDNLKLSPVKQLKENTIYIPKKHNFIGINDQIAYGNYESMRLYCLCVDNLLEICDSGIIYNPEKILQEHLKLCNINICKFIFNYRLVRRNSLKKNPNLQEFPTPTF